MFAELMKLSYRDLERCLILYGLAQPVSASSVLLAYAIALRVGRPKLFDAIRRGELAGHKDAITLLGPLQAKYDDWVSSHMIFLHEAHLMGFNSNSLPEEIKTALVELRRSFQVSPEKLLTTLFNRIDIKVEF